jgi:hypothetical protein
MSNHTLEGDEWKRQRIEKRKPITRAEEQERINKAYRWGKMDREEWSQRTDDLSDPLKWTAEGRTKHTPLKDTKQP